MAATARNGMSQDERAKKIAETFRERLGEALRQKNWTPKDLASALKWNTENIKDYLQGKKDPKFAQVAVMAEALGVTCDFLAGYSSVITKDIETAKAQEALGLDSLSQAAVDRLKDLLSLTGHWRRDCLHMVKADDRWTFHQHDPVASRNADIYFSTFEEWPDGPISHNYDGLHISAAGLIDYLLTTGSTGDFSLDALLISCMKYLVLKDAFAYTLRLRAAEFEQISLYPVLRKYAVNEYDNKSSGLEGSNYPKAEHDAQLKQILHEQTIIEAEMQKTLLSILNSVYDNMCYRLKLNDQHNRVANEVIEDWKKWIRTYKAHQRQYLAEVEESLFVSEQELQYMNSMDPPVDLEYQKAVYEDWKEEYEMKAQEDERIQMRREENKKGRNDG